MHELSIVMGIIEIAEEAVASKPDYAVKSIELEIGTMAGVIPEALDMAWESAIKDTFLEFAERKISWVKAEARCSDCGKDFDIKVLYDACPHCGSFYSDVLKGKELRVKALEIEQMDELKV
jgi:hydrogenase nickel incorporation protein HypA/HybF